MGHNVQPQLPLLAPDRLEAYLRRRGFPDVRLETFEPLGRRGAGDMKAHGYGCPIHATFTAGGRRHEVVLRTMRSDPHGHDRRSDRIAAMALGMDTFNEIPRHVRALDMGAFDRSGNLTSLPSGEPFLLTDYAPGRLYADDLSAFEKSDSVAPRDLEKARTLAEYLAELHGIPEPPHRYRRSVRDTIGHGEGIFGLIDTFPEHPSIPSERLQRYEHAVLPWRWTLRSFEARCRRTHGDFHPYNLLFTDDDELRVLDCSRGAAGEPADDVTCLSINYVFFALVARGVFEGPLRQLWSEFWSTYLSRTNDRTLLKLVAPFFAWRALVLASPTWYPDVPDEVRDAILRFAERLLGGATFEPDRVERLLA